jgi:leader peptidase (prepilin peptidase)/N-methyltransferase
VRYEKMGLMIYLLFAAITGLTIDILLLYLLKQKRYPFSIFLSFIVMLVLYKTFGEETQIIKGFLFAQILIFTGYYDLKTKTIPDVVHVLILLTALINIVPLQSIMGFIIVPIPFLLAALIKANGVGGGDVKFMAACGFLLGVKGGFVACIIGLMLAVVINSIYYKIKSKDKNISFALAPYLGIGCFMAYLKII